MPRARWLVLAALGVATAAVVTLDATGTLFDDSGGVSLPPPLMFESPEQPTPALTAVTTNDSAALSPSVTKAVNKALGDGDLGSSVHAFLLSGDGTKLFSQDGNGPATPASTLKLLTALATLDVLPPSTRIETTVVNGSSPNQIVLVGGGDATLTVQNSRRGAWPAASLGELVRRTVESLEDAGRAQVRLAYDDSLFTGPSVAPEWEPTYVSSGVLAPVTSLMADQGLINDESVDRYPDPALAAATQFAAMLEKAGIEVKGETTQVAAATSSTELASVQSPPLDILVERMLRDSDNQLAESLGRLAAEANGQPASFAGAVQTILQQARLRQVDVDDVELDDASGLSRSDTVTAATLAQVLQEAVDDPTLRPILTGLPVAGFDGTLVDRYTGKEERAAAGVVRAKTGTLTGVTAEAGTTLTCHGELVVFAFLADETPFDPIAARDALDRAVAALSACH